MKPKNLVLDLAEASRLILCLRNAANRLKERRAQHRAIVPINETHASEIQADLRYWLNVEQEYEDLAKRIEALWSK